jgi:GntR family transcriptional regulator
MLNKSSGVPLHNQLANLIREQVLTRQLNPEDRLPSEREFCEQYGISRITVRQAIGALVQEGLLYSTAGKGTFVSGSALNEELQPLNSFSKDLERRGMKPRNILLDARVLPADEPWARQLCIPRGSEIVYLYRLRLADEFPIAIQYTHLPHHLCPGLLAFDFSKVSLYEVLRKNYGLRLAHSATVIEAALATPAEARLLNLDLPSALLISEQTTHLDSGVTIEITRSIFNAQRYKLNSRI